MKPLFVALAFLTTLSLPAVAEDWASHLSPRMRSELGPMLSSHWSPKREVELTAAEKRDLGKMTPRLEEQARQLLRQAGTPNPPGFAPPIRETKGY